MSGPSSALLHFQRNRWKTYIRVYSGKLRAESLPAGSTSTPCRVCARDIAIGDHCVGCPGYPGRACCTCGFWRADEVDDASCGAFQQLVLNLRRRIGVSKGDFEILEQMQIVCMTSEGKLTWAAGGKRLFLEWKRSKEKSA